ncbi:MAG: UDP-N-acetylglucosamine 1-carboxyvinyltransferase [Candidatus Marinimicrobia bacterium]|nr:UDP-N-acetylglucosamine 1-carboxyvinyltransferase [Candidatus Neomarinimicrobiota bacterium]
MRGAKNAVFPIMAATIIVAVRFRFKNGPQLRDTYTMKRLLEMVGATVHYENNIMDIDTSGCDTPIAPYDLVKTMRASFYVLGPLLSRFNYAEVSLPGGCAWGPRPVDYHLQAMETLGANVDLTDGMIIAKGKLKGAQINFEQSSVGATGNALMAAVNSEGTTIIKNAAQEPEIEALCDFLEKMGSSIEGIGTSEITIVGKMKLHADIEYSVIPDRIEAGTFLIAGASTFGDVTVKNVFPGHLDILLKYLTLAGFKLDVQHNSIRISPSQNYANPVDMITEIYPGFPTDLQAQWMALMAIASGCSRITEKIYTDRFTHIAELTRFGAKIQLSDNKAEIQGISKLKGAPVMSTDIRASASLIIAALTAEGKSSISRIYHIDRGYDHIEDKFHLIGAKIKRIRE